MIAKESWTSFATKIDAIGIVINKVAKFIVLLCLGIMTPIVIVQVFRRYIFGHSFPWVEELARYLFIWITFVGSAIAIREKGHVAVTAIVSLLPKRACRFAELAVEISMGCLFLILIVTGTKQATLTWSQWASSLPIGMGWVYMALPVSGVIMFYHTFVSVLKLILIRGETE